MDNRSHKPAYPWWYCRKDYRAKKSFSRIGRILLQTICSFAGAALFYFKFHLPIIAGILTSMGLFVVISGFFLPKLHAGFDRLINLAAAAFGQALSWLLLLPFYYLCIFPARIILLCTGRDPMKRKWLIDQPTYWEEKQGGHDSDELTRQY